MTTAPRYICLIRQRDGAPWHVWTDVQGEPVTASSYMSLANKARKEVGFDNFYIYDRIEFIEPVLEPKNR